MSALRAELPELPMDMRRLPVDRRGYPVPWFVAWLDEEQREVPVGEGEPEFRVMRRGAVMDAAHFDRCWVCGGRLGRWRAFVIGPMCMVNRINSEPPSHVQCAEFAARACPFLSRPHAHRREAGMPEGGEAAGVLVERNPGVTAVWRFKFARYSFKRVPNGVLFNLPEPDGVRFYAEGRAATRAEVEESVRTGLPALFEVCETDEERAEVEALAERALTAYAPEPE